MYNRIVIVYVKVISETFVVKEEGGFRKGRACVDQTFSLRYIMEKVSEEKNMQDLWI